MEKGVVKIHKEQIEYLLRRISKKNVIVRVDDLGRLIVSAPPKVRVERVLEIIDNNKEKITFEIERKRRRAREEKGSQTIRILGRDIGRSEIEDVNRYIVDTGERVIGDIVAKYVEITGLSPAELRIKPLRSAWGICYSNRKITLNLWSIHLERELIEYIVLHELCHLKHMNHSGEFWREVERYMPDYKIKRKRLKECRVNWS